MHYVTIRRESKYEVHTFLLNQKSTRHVRNVLTKNNSDYGQNPPTFLCFYFFTFSLESINFRTRMDINPKQGNEDAAAAAKKQAEVREEAKNSVISRVCHIIIDSNLLIKVLGAGCHREIE